MNSSDDVDDEFDCYISFGNVKKQVLKYLDTPKHARTSDIVFDLGIDVDLVVEALNVLEEESLVKGKPVKVEINNSYEAYEQLLMDSSPIVAEKMRQSAKEMQKGKRLTHNEVFGDLLKSKSKHVNRQEDNNVSGNYPNTCSKLRSGDVRADSQAKIADLKTSASRYNSKVASSSDVKLVS